MDLFKVFPDHLSAQYSVNWVDGEDFDDEDKVGLKEKPEDTRYIKKTTLK